MEAPVRAAHGAPKRRALLWVAVALVIAALILGKILWP
jgi:hypothetical protein